MQIENTVAVVTGGARGLGQATVEHFLGEGGKVAIFDVDAERGQALADKYSGKTIYANVDVADEDSVQAGVQATMDAFGAIHICVNCAGINGLMARTVGKKGPYPVEEFNKAININQVGTFNVARITATEMLKNDPVGEDEERGVIINTSSLAGLEGQMGQIAYSSSKAGIIGMTLPMVRDLSQFHVRVFAIAPGLFATPMVESAPQEIKDKLIATLEFPKRMGKPSEFASLVGFIVENPYLNGDLIRIDAGTRAPPR